MLKRMGQLIFTTALLGLAICSSGCFPLVVGAAAGAGGVIWAKGELQETFKRNLVNVHDATIQSLKDLNILILSDRKDDLTAKLKAQLADGREIRISIEHLTKNSSKLSLRIGVLGDEAKSREILARIHKSL